jgi:hypothetical protein
MYLGSAPRKLQNCEPVRRQIESQAMRLFFSLTSFAFTMILALIAFTYTAIHFPTTMRDLLAGAKHAQDALSSLGLPDSYMVWVDIFLQPNQIVLVGYSIAMRLALSLLDYIIALIGHILFGGGEGGDDEKHSPSRSEEADRFKVWGRPRRS